MKIRNYEKTSFAYILCLLMLLLEIIFVILLFKYKEYRYEKLTGIVFDHNKILLALTKKERKNIYNNTYIYHKNKKIKYKIISDQGGIITKGHTKYYEIIIEYKFPEKLKTQDVVELSIKKDKYRLIEIFSLIWESD